MLQGSNLVPMTLKLQREQATEIRVQDKAETPFPEGFGRTQVHQRNQSVLSFQIEHASVLEIKQSNFYK